jgi:hypothetical protein
MGYEIPAKYDQCDNPISGHRELSDLLRDADMMGSCDPGSSKNMSLFFLKSTGPQHGEQRGHPLISGFILILSLENSLQSKYHHVPMSRTFAIGLILNRAVVIMCITCLDS